VTTQAIPIYTQNKLVSKVYQKYKYKTITVTDCVDCITLADDDLSLAVSSE
jgi:hypothetical protein